MGAVAATTGTAPAWQVAGVAVVVGVFVDLDHFVVARLTDGDWRSFRRLLANPTLPFGDASELFVDSDFDGLDRLLSHLLIAGAVVGGLAVVAPVLAVVAAVSLYVHLLADVYATIRGTVLFDAEEVPDELSEAN